jgi:hypothetical protein
MILPQPSAGRKPPGTESFCAHLPETLDLAAATRPEWADYAAWVVSAVVIRRYIDREADEMTFVPLAADYINAHIPAPVRRRLLDDLIRNNALETDNLYFFGPAARGGKGKCRCYRIGAAHRAAPIRPRVLTHHDLLRKLRTAWVAERAEVIDPVHLALRGWHDRVEVTPDAPRGAHPLLDRMLDGERRFTVCDQGRVHTNVANLPAQFRRYMRLDGRELDSVDINTSQPLLLALLLKKQAREEEADRPQAVCDTYCDDGLTDYLAHCLDGTVYDRLAGKTGYNRDEVKPLFLAVAYGHPDHMDTKVGRAMRSLYPAVFDAIVDLNYRLGHGGLPRLMQTLESQVMIGRVAARLVRENPEMPLLTVHDSILVPVEFVPVVQTVIAEEWAAEFGVVPRTKASSFTAPQLARPQRKRRRRSKCPGDMSRELAAQPPCSNWRQEGNVAGFLGRRSPSRATIRRS